MNGGSKLCRTFVLQLAKVSYWVLCSKDSNKFRPTSKHFIIIFYTSRYKYFLLHKNYTFTKDWWLFSFHVGLHGIRFWICLHFIKWIQVTERRIWPRTFKRCIHCSGPYYRRDCPKGSWHAQQYLVEFHVVEPIILMKKFWPHKIRYHMNRMLIESSKIYNLILENVTFFLGGFSSENLTWNMGAAIALCSGQ